MASPPELTCYNLNGKFAMNRSLCDDLNDMLVLQGIGWLTRKAINLATPTLTIREYEKEGVWHIDIIQIAAGISKQQENRTLNWTDRDHKDAVFGNVRGKTRMYKNGELQMEIDGNAEDKAFLEAQKLKDGSPSKWLDEDHVQSYVKNIDKGYGWEAEQTWGFEEIDGKKYYTRRVVCKKDGKTEYVRIVYNYTGPVEAEAGEDDGLAY